MDVTALHAATEDLAGYLSELTISDLRRTVPGQAGDVGELIERLVADNHRLAAELRRRLGDTESPGTAPDQVAATPPDPIAGPQGLPDLLYGGGFEIDYRRSAAAVEAAFAAANDAAAEIAELYRQRVADSQQYARDVATVLGLDQ